MSRYPNFKGPLFDPRGLGLASRDSQGHAWRQRHLAGISHNEAENVLIAFNADGLAMPLEFDRYALPRQLEQAINYKPCVAHGDGRYGLTAQRYRLMLGPDGLKNWITYWFAEPEKGFANDKKVFDSFEAEQEIKDLETYHDFESVISCPFLGKKYSKYTSTEEKRAAFDNDRAEDKRRIIEQCDAIYQQKMKQEQSLKEWLQGKTSQPNPLAGMPAA